jgi:hypothetical protein
MTTTVLRYRCDLCGKVWLMRGQADVCEMMCAEAEAQVDRSPKGQDAKGLGPKDESAVGNADAPKG